VARGRDGVDGVRSQDPGPKPVLTTHNMRADDPQDLLSLQPNLLQR
jgi:hypothetical protein